MLIRGRSCIAAITACCILLLSAAESYPSYNSEAGRKYAVAQDRLADLKKSVKKKKYRSYWIDCLRTFELIEKQYPKSTNAADACFDRGAVYFDLYQANRVSKDMDESLNVFGKCQSAYPKHTRAPEALYRIFDISLDLKQDRASAIKAYGKLSEVYPGHALTEKARDRINPSPRKKKPETVIRKPSASVIQSSGKVKLPDIVKSIRHWSGGAYTRIVIDQSGPVKFLAQELKKPDRLVFDLLNTRLDAALNKEPMPVNDGILKQVRASQHAPKTVRIVLDLASLKNYKAFSLHDPERLVIDVTGEGGKTGETRESSGNTGIQQKAENGYEIKPSPDEERKSEQKTTPPLQLLPPAKTAEPGKNDADRLSLSRQLALKISTIAIDAGHGGHDPGAIGKSGMQEKTITLDVAKRLAVLVKERLGCNVVMTRDSDTFIPLEQRPFIAKSRGADLFVSIHVNANRKRKARGIETYVQSLRASDRDAMATAARENAMSTKKLSELKTELDRIFADLTRDDKIEESLYLADSVQGSLVNNLKLVNLHADDLKAKIKRAFFYVLINTEMPSILAEVGFISNPDEEKLLKKESYRQNIAESLFQGVKKYIDARSSQPVGI